MIDHVDFQLDLVRIGVKRTMAEEVSLEKERNQELKSEEDKKCAVLAAGKERIKHLEDKLANLNVENRETNRSQSLRGKQRASEEWNQVVYNTNEQEGEVDFVSDERRGV